MLPRFLRIDPASAIIYNSQYIDFIDLPTLLFQYMYTRHKTILPFTLAIFLAILTYTSFANPSSASADVISILSSVFKNESVSKQPEIDQISAQNQNIQNMPLLVASLSPNGASSTSETLKDIRTNASIVNGKAFTNENSPVTDVAAEYQDSGIYDVGAASDRISLYTVRPGDTLQQIAEMYDVTPNTILWANDMTKKDALKPDQVLIILPISGIKYTVKKGDTLASIASKYKTDLADLASLNGYDRDDSLLAGSAMIIPSVDGPAAPGSVSTPKSSKPNTSGKSASDTSKPSSGASGYLSRPVARGIRTQGIHGHNAVDIASSLGTPILAAASGKVIVVKTGGWDGGYGDYVVIQHPNGMQTLYAHMSAVLVSSGQSVSKGQQIGKMGSTGDSTGVHLHFEVRGGKNPF